MKKQMEWIIMGKERCQSSAVAKPSSSSRDKQSYSGHQIDCLHCLFEILKELLPPSTLQIQITYHQNSLNYTPIIYSNRKDKVPAIRNLLQSCKVHNLTEIHFLQQHCLITLLKFLAKYMDIGLYQICMGIVIGYSILGWLVLTGIKINYGRLSNSLTKVYFSPRIGWFIFEVPNLIWAAYFLFYLKNPITLPYTLFIIHYINRDIIYPLRLKSATKVPLQILLSAFSFTFGNGYLQGIANQQHQDLSWLRSLLGIAVFAFGMWINVHSDNILQEAKEKLAKEGSNRYIRIDQFLFKYISNPNYFGEVIEWVGYAIASGHSCAWLFVFSTINVLTPAAMVRSAWNKKNIVNYPQERKAILPFVI